MPLILLTGDEPLLVSRAVDEAVATARSVDPDTTKVIIDLASESAAGDLANAVQPNLFGGSSVVVCENFDKVDDDALAIISAEHGDDITMVLVHPGGVGGKAALKLIREAGANEITCTQVRKGRAVIEFMSKEFASHKRKVTPGAVEAVYESIGHDMGMLVAAISQLCADVTSDPIDVDDVRQYFMGAADVSGFEIADSLWARKPTDALIGLRQSLSSGDRSDVATVSALAMGLRSMIRLAGAPRGAADTELARTVGAPPWKIKTIRGQLQRWRPGQLAAAVLRLAAADAAVKGGLRRGEALDPEQKLFAVERLVVEISARETE